MKVVKRKHPVWEQAHKSTSGTLILSPIGEYQYIYSSGKGRISMVELPNYFYDGITLWEIYCLEGNLFDDVERFKSKEEAEERIKELLREGEKVW